MLLWTCTYKFPWEHVFKSLAYTPRSGIPGSCVILYLTFLRDCQESGHTAFHSSSGLLRVVYDFAQRSGQLSGSCRPQNFMLPRPKRSHVPQINCLHCLNGLENYPRQSHFEDAWKGTKLIGHLREVTLLLACGSATAILQEVVWSLSSLSHWRPSTLRRANVSFTEFDNWGHLGALGAERQQVATAGEMGRRPGVRRG